MAVEVLNVLSSWAIGELFTVAKGVVLDMLELIIKSLATLYIIRLVLKHNLFISKLIVKIKFLGIHIEVDGKEKKHPSAKD